MEPIAHRYELACRPEHAFAVFTERISEWWPPAYTSDPGSFQTATIEPWTGGRVYATHRDLGEFDWGTVTAWEPPGRLAYHSILAQPADVPSQVSVRFEPRSGGCTMWFEHGGWNGANAAYRAKFTDWPLILDRFAALAEGAGAAD